MICKPNSLQTSCPQPELDLIAAGFLTQLNHSARALDYHALALRPQSHRRAAQCSRLRPAGLLCDVVVVIFTAIRCGVLRPLRLGLGRCWGGCRGLDADGWGLRWPQRGHGRPMRWGGLRILRQLLQRLLLLLRCAQAGGTKRLRSRLEALLKPASSLLPYNIKQT